MLSCKKINCCSIQFSVINDLMYASCKHIFLALGVFTIYPKCQTQRVTQEVSIQSREGQHMLGGEKGRGRWPWGGSRGRESREEERGDTDQSDRKGAPREPSGGERERTNKTNEREHRYVYWEHRTAGIGRRSGRWDQGYGAQGIGG